MTMAERAKGPIAIRRFAAGDGPVLLTMVAALAEDHNLTTHLHATAADYERAFAGDGAVRGAFIAEVDGAPAGCAIWHASFSSFRGGEVMYLEDISVLPAFRRRGVARALMAAVARTCRERGWPSIYWIMMSDNHRGRALYQSLGAELAERMSWVRLHGPALEALAS